MLPHALSALLIPRAINRFPSAFPPGVQLCARYAPCFPVQIPQQPMDSRMDSRFNAPDMPWISPAFDLSRRVLPLNALVDLR